MILATHSIRQFPLHFPSLESPCAITFQLESTIRPDSQSGKSEEEENLLTLPLIVPWFLGCPNRNLVIISTTLSCHRLRMKKDNEFSKHWPSSDIMFSSATRQNWAYKELRLD